MGGYLVQVLLPTSFGATPTNKTTTTITNASIYMYCITEHIRIDSLSIHTGLQKVRAI